MALLREQRYRQRFLVVDRRQSTAVLIVIALAFYTTARNDFALLEGSPVLTAALVNKLLHLVVTAGGLVLLWRARSPWRYDRILAVLNLCTGLSIGFSQLTRFTVDVVHAPTIAAGALLAVVYFAQRGPLWDRVALAILISLCTLVLLWNPQATLSSAMRTTGPLVLVALNVVGIISARSFEEQRRQRFIAAMNHEFRTPMNAVIGLSDLLRDAPLEPTHAELVRTIHDSARGLLVLLNNILDFAKIDAGRLELSPAPFSLRELASSVTTMMRPSVEHRDVTVTATIEPDVPEHVLGDEPRLRQVLVNLVANAVKFTERGTVTLSVRGRARQDDEHELQAVGGAGLRRGLLGSADARPERDRGGASARGAAWRQAHADAGGHDGQRARGGSRGL